MKLAILLACVLAAYPQQAGDVKHFAISSPVGTVASMTADSILREPSLIHLKGNVEIKIRWTTGPAGKYVIVHADEAEYHINTGEVEPRGKVRVDPVIGY